MNTDPNPEQNIESAAGAAPVAIVPSPVARTGKIARLPHEVRRQINHRLREGQSGTVILRWLNALPEVQAVLTSEFEGTPVSPSNLSHWRRGGYRDWLAAQDGLAMLQSLEDQESLGHAALADKFIEKLSRWTALHYASTAQALVAAETRPEVKWERLQSLSREVDRLRRGDFQAERAALDRKRLEMDEANAIHRREKEFWQWTKREDIHEQLYPKSEGFEGGLSAETIRKLEEAIGVL